MRQRTYLNAILTVNAVLLAAILGALLSDGNPLGPRSATAAGDGFPNAASQRQQIVQAINDMKKSVEATTRKLESGKLKVEVTNLDEIQVNVNGS